MTWILSRIANPANIFIFVYVNKTRPMSGPASPKGHCDLENRSRSFKIGGAHLQYVCKYCAKFERHRLNTVRVRDYTNFAGRTDGRSRAVHRPAFTFGDAGKNVCNMPMNLLVLY